MAKVSAFLRTFDVVMILVLIGAVAWTFKIKDDTDKALDKLTAIEKQIQAERTEIDILKSDWGLLTSPDRLQKLHDRFGDKFDLQSIEAGQIINLETLPPFKQQMLEQNSESMAGKISDFKTGSVNEEGVDE